MTGGEGKRLRSAKQRGLTGIPQPGQQVTEWLTVCGLAQLSTGNRPGTGRKTGAARIGMTGNKPIGIRSDAGRAF